jgi:hypothetical protein
MRFRLVVFLFFVLVFVSILPAQQARDARTIQVPHGDAGGTGGIHSVDGLQRYHRLICIVHLKGNGSKDDVRRPEYAPDAVSADRSGIIAWSMQVTDDDQMAIVQYAAVDRAAFAAILADRRPEIKVFEVGADKQSDIEAHMRKFKKDFTLDSLKVVAQ